MAIRISHVHTTVESESSDDSDIFLPEGYTYDSEDEDIRKRNQYKDQIGKTIATCIGLLGVSSWTSYLIYVSFFPLRWDDKDIFVNGIVILIVQWISLLLCFLELSGRLLQLLQNLKFLQKRKNMIPGTFYLNIGVITASLIWNIAMRWAMFSDDCGESWLDMLWCFRLTIARGFIYFFTVFFGFGFVFGVCGCCIWCLIGLYLVVFRLCSGMPPRIATTIDGKEV